MPTRTRSLIVLVSFAVAAAAACNRNPESPASGGTPAADTAAPAANAVPRPKAGWTVTEGIATPESVYFDEASGFIFTSQIDGQPDARDGNGRIVKLGADGSVIAADWVTGLNAPKGLRAHDGMLWTADLDELVAIDIASGRIASRVKVPGAQFLNDVAIGSDGTVYVSDFLGNRIYAVKNGAVSTFAEGEHLEYPNGLIVDGERLIVGGWGKPEADFTTKVPGRLYMLDLKTKQKTLITKQPLGNIDGVEQEARGGFLVTDYMAGKLIQVTATGESRVVRQFKPGLADHTFLYAQGDILIAPHMNENTVAAYDISGDMK